jgi:hypothetical protein
LESLLNAVWFLQSEAFGVQQLAAAFEFSVKDLGALKSGSKLPHSEGFHVHFMSYWT